MSWWDRLQSWWHRDTLERAEEEAINATPAEREAAEEDYEAHQDEKFVDEHFGLQDVGFDRDSEPPEDS